MRSFPSSPSRWFAVAAAVTLGGAAVAQAPSRRSALDRAAQQSTDPRQNQGALPVQAQAPTGQGIVSGPFNLLQISTDLMTAIGTSTEPDPIVQQLQGGHHDPRKRGFTLQQAEVQITGAIDPYFRGQFVMVTSLDTEGESIFEIEEAWLTTQQLPASLLLRAGVYLTDFGRVNTVHPHQWDFMDQPVMHTRLFGEDGMRGPGARLAWLAPTETYFEAILGAQNANGETMHSFLSSEESYEERPLGGRAYVEDAQQVRTLGDVVWSGRLASAVDFDDSHTLGAGISGLFGPNATGFGADTVIYGADLMFRWRPIDNRRGYPFFKVQGEILGRSFLAAEQTDVSDPLVPATVQQQTLDDYGGYLYAAWGFDVGWAVALRGEYATGSGGSYSGSGAFDRAQDPFRADRTRWSPMLSWQTSEYSRVRLQYNLDRSDHLEQTAHSVWLNFEILIGPHLPHSY